MPSFLSPLKEWNNDKQAQSMHAYKEKRSKHSSVHFINKVDLSTGKYKFYLCQPTFVNKFSKKSKKRKEKTIHAVSLQIYSFYALFWVSKSQ